MTVRAAANAIATDQTEDVLFDGPLAPFFDAVVRMEDGLSRLLAPLARRVDRSAK